MRISILCSLAALALCAAACEPEALEDNGVLPDTDQPDTALVDTGDAGDADTIDVGVDAEQDTSVTGPCDGLTLNAEAGAALYTGNFCNGCHGDEGERMTSGGEAKLVDTAMAQEIPYIYDKISGGVNEDGKIMSAYGKENGGPLEPQELCDLAAYVKSFAP